MIGTTEIRLGDESTAYSNANPIVWPALYDGGFFPIGTTNNGRYLNLRRTYLNADITWGDDYFLNEVRAY